MAVPRRPKHGRLLPAALVVGLSGFLAADAPARGVPLPARAVDTPMAAAPRAARTAAWAEDLPPLDVTSVQDGARIHVRLYGEDGEIDESARAAFERLVARDGEQHPLAPRVEQLLVKASHHFGDAAVTIVSAWRPHAGRHTSGDALDFKLAGVKAATLAAYLRGLPRAGVGIYTHPRTQYVHLDVRDPSYHWIDGSPPGVTWRERGMRDPGQVKRDAGWTPEGDLPL
ncbi:MAG TPA: DUF882 domain-containing protein [Polyangiaceae bacterium]